VKDVLKKLEKVTAHLVPPTKWLSPEDKEYRDYCKEWMFYLTKQKTH